MPRSTLAVATTCLLVGLSREAQCFAPTTRRRTRTPSSTHLHRRRHQPSRRPTATALAGDVATEESVETVQDESLADPASVVFYDDFLDPDNPLGVVCARGVCVLPDFDDDVPTIGSSNGEGAVTTSMPPLGDQSLVERILGSYLGPRLLLAFASVLYGTNFPLGSMMNDSLPPSAATSARMLLASLALSPFLLKLEGELAASALLCGTFTAVGYISQSLSLVDTSPAKVAFLGAATVLVCPALEALVDGKDVSVGKRPQTWLAAALCLSGVGILELWNPGSGGGDAAGALGGIGVGDLLALLQAVGFGTSFFLTERMMTKVPGQALPITAVQVSVTAFLSMVWCVSDGWIGTEGAGSYGLPSMFLEPTLRMASLAVLWTGIATTALNRFIETTALGKMKSAEASVILATEPLWASLFAALWLGEDFGANDYVGGALIVLACLATALRREDFAFVLGNEEKEQLR
mmetsp:Transcript_26421/g.59583  ORF Transcript_26421/g.59583 Transcript_26421/m.59583 type:complete len:465 (-) Transcript_26421:58-1452(-)